MSYRALFEKWYKRAYKVELEHLRSREAYIGQPRATDMWEAWRACEDAIKRREVVREARERSIKRHKEGPPTQAQIEAAADAYYGSREARLACDPEAWMGRPKEWTVQQGHRHDPAFWAQFMAAPLGADGTARAGAWIKTAGCYMWQHGVVVAIQMPDTGRWHVLPGFAEHFPGCLVMGRIL